jgi:hypothetical protein
MFQNDVFFEKNVSKNDKIKKNTEGPPPLKTSRIKRVNANFSIYKMLNLH